MEGTALREKRRPGLCELPWEPVLSPCSLAWARLFRDSRTSIISRWRHCFGSAESYFGDSSSSASSAAELPFPKCSENDRRYDENVKKRTDHTAENRRGQRLHDFRTGMRGPHDGEQTCDNGGHRHHFRAQSKKGSFHHGLMQRIDREFAAARQWVGSAGQCKS